MGFKKLRGVKIPEEQQGLIRYTCLTYYSQPNWIREKIDRLCKVYGGEYSDALFETMCSRESVRKISIKHNVSEEQIYKKRKLFYENWYKRKLPSTTDKNSRNPYK